MCQEITAPEFQSKLFRGDDIFMLDVREIEEYRSGHVEGSVLIPVGVLPHLIPDVDKQREVIIMCRSGNRSQEACQILQQRGFTNVKSLQGGLTALSA
ncbi:rhodanese-like domain-containing protein [Alicyclobacillus sp. SO9]|uniref:rhodanese-like domain-containing protein n=1 Tax=Alicyclobacillus sp. SO9 TaxID=2665646 RepID=UPI0018E903DF|nr:rhodanese-like domain-containing protein [Alicyclobacillus sp. SO9]QQE79887.1 rhodanese-like domain-containing protein [Alicyclobacillus sp. SO9]